MKLKIQKKRKKKKDLREIVGSILRGNFDYLFYILRGDKMSFSLEGFDYLLGQGSGGADYTSTLPSAIVEPSPVMSVDYGIPKWIYLGGGFVGLLLFVTLLTR